MKFFGLILACMYVLLSLKCSSESNSDHLLNPTLQLSELLLKADSITEAGDTVKALAIYNHISNQAKQLPPKDTINAKAALYASLTEAEICFGRLSDYGKTLNALTKAQKTASRYAFPKIPIDFMSGILYFTVAEQNNETSYFEKAADYFVKVLDEVRETDSTYADYAVSNLILCSDRGKVRSISKNALDRYFSSSDVSHSNGYQFNLGLDSILRALNCRDYQQAMEIITRLSKSSGLPNHRVLPSIYFISGRISTDAGNPNEALKFFLESETLADPKHGKDMALQVYEALEDTYASLGNEFMTGKYAAKANRLRREMTSFSQISSFKQAEFSDEIDMMESNLTQEKEKSRNRLRWSIIGLTFAVLAAIIIGMLLYFMKKLQEKNKVLYLRYVELLELSNSSSPVPSQPADRTDNIIKAQEEPSVPNLIEEDSSAVDPDDYNTAEIKDESIENKDASDRTFTEEVQKIEEVISDYDELFSPDFSAATLSVLTGIRTRLLSTIISEKYHTTFRNLINSRRIRAVCFQLETGSAYDNLTVDAIAESIGIRSRATFTSAFKRETGMTPAQYIRFAQQRRESKSR